MAEDFKPHLFVNNVHFPRNYKITPRNRSGINTIPERDRDKHGKTLLSELEQVWRKTEHEQQLRKKKSLPVIKGGYITFKSAESGKLKHESLDSSGARLLNVKLEKSSNQEIATIFIPAEKKEALIGKITTYADSEVIANYNNDLVARIEQILRADIEFLLE